MGILVAIVCLFLRKILLALKKIQAGKQSNLATAQEKEGVKKGNVMLFV